MKIVKVMVVCLVIGLFGVVVNRAQNHSKTYEDTRKLLLEMDRSHANTSLKKLFEEGDERQGDLIQLLYDPEQKVSLNAQSIILYLADPPALSALEEWYSDRKKKKQDYWISPVKIIKEIRYLEGKDGDLTKFVLKNLYPESKIAWGTQIACNETYKTCLIEVVFGEIFTDGRHVVIRKEDGKWRLLSNYLVWQS